MGRTLFVNIMVFIGRLHLLRFNLMNRKALFLCLLLNSVLIVQCTEEPGPTPGTGSPGGANGNPEPRPEWLIPQGSVFDAGPGVDGIPSLTNPELVNADDLSAPENADLILGLKIGETIRAYPHSILNWHEIINDDIGDLKLAITYCPLTGTGVGWNREIAGKLTTFGVSGLLYNSNLIPYDRSTESNWSQMLLKCVNGEQIGTKIETHQLIETTWESWKDMYPNTKVVSSSGTGYTWDYSQYPYGDYITDNDQLLFPLSVEDKRFPSKERVLGVVINEKAKAYRFNNISQSGTIGTINQSFQDTDIVIVGSQIKNFLVAYNRTMEDGTILNFSPVQDALPIVMTDEEGNQWDITGLAISGPRSGSSLKHTDSFIGFWIAWGAFYPELPVR